MSLIALAGGLQAVYSNINRRDYSPDITQDATIQSINEVMTTNEDRHTSLVAEWEAKLVEEGMPDELPYNVAFAPGQQKIVSKLLERLAKKNDGEVSVRDLTENVRPRYLAPLIDQYGLRITEKEARHELYYTPGQDGIAAIEDHMRYTKLQVAINNIFESLREREAGVIALRFGIPALEGDAKIESLMRDYTSARTQLRESTTERLAMLESSIAPGITEEGHSEAEEPIQPPSQGHSSDEASTSSTGEANRDEDALPLTYEEKRQAIIEEEKARLAERLDRLKRDIVATYESEKISTRKPTRQEMDAANSSETKNYDQIGKNYDVVNERVLQIELHAMTKLKHPSRSAAIAQFVHEDEEFDLVAKPKEPSKQSPPFRPFDVISDVPLSSTTDDRPYNIRALEAAQQKTNERYTGYIDLPLEPRFAVMGCNIQIHSLTLKLELLQQARERINNRGGAMTDHRFLSESILAVQIDRMTEQRQQLLQIRDGEADRMAKLENGRG